MLRMHLIEPTWWGVEKVIQSNHVSCVEYGLFICETTHLVKVLHINKPCILRFGTYLVQNSGSLSYPFLG